MSVFETLFFEKTFSPFILPNILKSLIVIHIIFIPLTNEEGEKILLYITYHLIILKDA